MDVEHDVLKPAYRDPPRRLEKLDLLQARVIGAKGESNRHQKVMCWNGPIALFLRWTSVAIRTVADQGDTSMQTVTTIGLDLAKSVLQVHGVDSEGVPVIRRALRRSQVLEFFRGLPPCLVGLEACATSHYWAREIGACGHEVRLIPPIYVKAYVKRGKTDTADAEAICEAVTRPTMRFVPIKDVEQQAAGMLLRTRDLFVLSWRTPFGPK